MNKQVYSFIRHLRVSMKCMHTNWDIFEMMWHSFTLRPTRLFLNKIILSYGYIFFFFVYRCRKVCQFWRHLFNSEWIWHQLCHAPKWRLGDSENQAQLERHRLSGSLCWRSVFRERFKLKRSWLRGQCHVRTFEVRFHTNLDKSWQVLTSFDKFRSIRFHLGLFPTRHSVYSFHLDCHSFGWNLFLYFLCRR